MYQIGLFSKMNHVTIKTLHHYDSIGLLKPTKIDPETGYRYYSLGQSYALHRINALKHLGFSLDDIKAILEGKSKNTFLLKRKAELLEEIANKTKRLAEIEYYLSGEEELIAEEYEILVKEIPPVIVVSKRMVLPSYKDLFQVMPQLGNIMRELGCVCSLPEYCFNRYYDAEYKEENIDVELCEAVTKLQPDAKGVTFKQLPKIEKAACLFHKGSYETLPKAYLALTTWMETNRYELSELPRESYLDGIWNKNNPEDWITEIQFPIKDVSL